MKIPEHTLGPKERPVIGPGSGNHHGRTTTYAYPSVSELLRMARNEAELDEILAAAITRMPDASRATVAKWKGVTAGVRARLRGETS